MALATVQLACRFSRESAQEREPEAKRSCHVTTDKLTRAVLEQCANARCAVERMGERVLNALQQPTGPGESLWHRLAAVRNHVRLATERESVDEADDLLRQHVASLQYEALKLQRRYSRELAGLRDSVAIAWLLEWDLNALVVTQSRQLAERLRLLFTSISLTPTVPAVVAAQHLERRARGAVAAATDWFRLLPVAVSAPSVVETESQSAMGIITLVCVGVTLALVLVASAAWRAARRRRSGYSRIQASLASS